jgi:predicted phage gp36 major capsid-like protein
MTHIEHIERLKRERDIEANYVVQYRAAYTRAVAQRDEFKERAERAEAELRTLEAQIAQMTESAREVAELMQPTHEQCMAQAIRITTLETIIRDLCIGHEDCECAGCRAVFRKDVPSPSADHDMLL